MKTANFRKTAAILSVVAVLGTAGVAAANPAYHSSAPLSQEQMTKAQELISAYRTAVAPLEQQVNAKQAELQALLYSATPDKSRIEAISKDIGAIQGQIYASEASLNAQLTKEGIPVDGPQGNRQMAHGYGHRGGHGGGHGGGHW